MVNLQTLLGQCDVSVSRRQLVIKPPKDKDLVNFIPVALRKNAPVLQDYLAENGYEGALIHHSGKKPFQVIAAQPKKAIPLLSSEDKLRKISEIGDRELLLAMQYMMKQEEAGRIICIVGQKTDLCKHTNDLLTEERGLRKPELWTGYNYRRSWCTDSDNPETPSKDYDDLMKYLARDGKIDNFPYRLYRPDDGAIVEYQTDYRYVGNWLGESVRIGYSWPQDYRVLVPGDPSRVIA